MRFVAARNRGVGKGLLPTLEGLGAGHVPLSAAVVPSLAGGLTARGRRVVPRGSGGRQRERRAGPGRVPHRGSVASQRRHGPDDPRLPGPRAAPRPSGAVGKESVYTDTWSGCGRSPTSWTVVTPWPPSRNSWRPGTRAGGWADPRAGRGGRRTVDRRGGRAHVAGRAGRAVRRPSGRRGGGGGGGARSAGARPQATLRCIWSRAQELAVAVELYAAGVPLSAISRHLRELRGEVSASPRVSWSSRPSTSSRAIWVSIRRATRKRPRRPPWYASCDHSRSRRWTRNWPAPCDCSPPDTCVNVLGRVRPRTLGTRRVPVQLPVATMRAVETLVGPAQVAAFVAAAVEREVQARTLDHLTSNYNNHHVVGETP